MTPSASDPVIWRPGTTTLARFHRVLQAALGWTERHLHQFVVGKTIYGDPDVLIDDPSQASTRRPRLGQVAPGVGATLRYEYDFGDGWDHLIVVERLLWHDRGAQGTVCLAGGEVCSPGDCGRRSGRGVAAILKAHQGALAYSENGVSSFPSAGNENHPTRKPTLPPVAGKRSVV